MNDAAGASRLPDALARLDLAPLVWSSGAVVAAIADRAGVLLDVNPTFERLAGRDPRGENIATFVGEGQAEAFAAWLLAAATGWTTRTWGALPGADHLAHDFRFAVCGSRDTLVLIGEPLATDDLASALLDVNEGLVEEHRRLDKDNERLDRVAQQDALTGVANRRAFDSRLAHEVELAAAGGAFSVVLLDIDHFKVLNDRYGHPAGDGVLRWLGGILRAAARRTDLVARYGGEEFVAILPAADTASAALWANRLRRVMREEPAPGVETAVSISAGVAAWAAGDTGSHVLARADQALYSAKRSGRDRVAVDGVEPPPFNDAMPGLPAPVWHASSIGIAIIEGTVVRRVNGALGRLLGALPDNLLVGSLVHPDQAPAFTEFVRSAGTEWTRATFGMRTDACGVPLDYVTWARKRGRIVELLIEPATAERDAVEQTLLALVDDMVEVQRELEQRAKALKRALADKAEAEKRAAKLERVLPICAWCGRIWCEQADGGQWMPLAEFLDVAGITLTKGPCDRCKDSLSLGS